MTEKEMLIRKFSASGISERAISAFRKIKRENFVPREYKEEAYDDIPLPIPAGQTISQPTTIMVMLDALELEKNSKVLEIGAGSGYNAALMGAVCSEGKVISVEFSKELCEFASGNLRKAGIENAKVINSDGTQGYSKEAPYDRIICTAAVPEIPEEWFDQLKEGGIIVAPVGPQDSQTMTKIKKTGGEREVKQLGDFVFVPSRGKYGYNI